MKWCIALAVVVMAIPAPAQHPAALPPQADLAMKTYEREVALAREKALRQLQAILATETQRANHASAQAVKTAIASLSSSTNAAVAAVVPPKTGNISIKAGEKFGAELGTFTAGTTLKLQYVEGRWAVSGGSGSDPTTWVSPDDPGVFEGNRLGIYAVLDGEAKLLAEVPAGTKRRAFRHRFDKNYPMVILRIVDGNPVDNPGFAIYNVEVLR